MIKASLKRAFTYLCGECRRFILHPWDYLQGLLYISLFCLEDPLGSVICHDGLIATISLPVLLNLQLEGKTKRPWHNSNLNLGALRKHIKLCPALFQLGNVTGLKNFPHASLLDGSTHSGGCTATRVLEGGPQSAVQLPHMDRRWWHSTWGSGQVRPCLVTWTRKLSAHELVLVPLPLLYRARAWCSFHLQEDGMGMLLRQTSHRLMSLMNRPAIIPYPTLSVPWVALLPGFGENSHFNARNRPHQRSQVQPRLRPKSVSPWP